MDRWLLYALPKLRFTFQMPFIIHLLCRKTARGRYGNFVEERQLGEMWFNFNLSNVSFVQCTNRKQSIHEMMEFLYFFMNIFCIQIAQLFCYCSPIRVNIKHFESSTFRKKVFQECICQWVDRRMDHMWNVNFVEMYVIGFPLQVHGTS